VAASYKIFLADDHGIVREAVKASLEKLPDVQVIGEARDGQELLTLLKEMSPDLIILDISMPQLSGLEAVQQIQKVRPQARILILTMHKSGEYLRQALEAGVQGYLLKENVFADLLSAIQTVRSGGTYISPLIAGELRHVLTGKKALGASPIPSLNPREVEVLRLLGQGKSSKEIGDLLFISVPTVNTHRHNLKKKLNCRTIAELVKYAIKCGLVDQSL
jgi:DNA-binding NarL/FixJ family response regulator